MSKIKTLSKFMKNPLKYAANQASCVSKGKNLGLKHFYKIAKALEHYYALIQQRIKIFVFLKKNNMLKKGRVYLLDLMF